MGEVKFSEPSNAKLLHIQGPILLFWGGGLTVGWAFVKRLVRCHRKDYIRYKIFKMQEIKLTTTTAHFNTDTL